MDAKRVLMVAAVVCFAVGLVGVTVAAGIDTMPWLLGGLVSMSAAFAI